MIRQVLTAYPYAVLSCAALLLFFGVFIVAAGMAYRSDAKNIHGRAALLPLEEE